jgi:cobalt-zinc-cadmium efflux system outer membrane protein
MKRSLLFVFATLLLWTHVCHGQTVLSVRDAVAYALSHRPELRAANDRVSASEHLRSQAGLIPNPRILFRKEDFTDHLNVGANSQTYWEGEQLLETSGKRGGRIVVAQQGMEQSRLQAELERRQIVLNVRESYWKAKAAQSLAALYAQDADYFRQVIEYQEARFREGKIAEVDLLRVRLQGEEIRAAAAHARLDFEKALLMLARLLSTAPSNWRRS